MTTASVYLWGELVGALRWDASRQLGDFAYNPEFARQGMEISPLVMPLSETEIYTFPKHRDSNTFCGLPGLVADSLPERYGNRLMATWLAMRGLSFNDLDPVQRLCYLGARGMGALEFIPDNNPAPITHNAIEMDDLVDIARQIMDEHNKTSPLETQTPNLDQLIQIGTSAGGAKAKAVIAWNKNTHEIRSGQGACPPGFTHYLLKLSNVSNHEHESDADIGRLEMAYHLMAIHAGITMTHCELLEDNNGVAHFMTERFDRSRHGEKYHVQTYCAIAHQDRDPVGLCNYEHLFATARKLGITQQGINELFLRMVFNIITRNQDDHSKNHAFMMDGTGTWHITPAYDLCLAYKKGSRFIDLHQMRCNGKRDNFTRDDLLCAAQAAGVRNPIKLINQVREAVALWPDFSREVGLTGSKAKAIKRLFRYF